MVEALRGHRHLVNLVFIVVLLLGGWSYFSMPRSQYPEVKLNWVAIATVWPGASAADVERRLTLPLESVLRQVDDIRYVAATSRDHVSAVLVRFQDVPQDVFETRLQALSHQVQAAADEFPAEAKAPQIIELTTSSMFHTAMITVGGDAGDAVAGRLAETVRRDLELMPGVARVWSYGLRTPEIQVTFDPQAVDRHQAQLQGMIDMLVRQAGDYPAGGLSLDGRNYSVRVQGLGADPEAMAALGVPTATGGEVALGQLAEVRRGLSNARERVSTAGKPVILLTVMKQEQANTLQLLDGINAYVAEKNRQLGYPALRIADDQTRTTRQAVRAMELNAVLGLLLVLIIVWLALGRRMALLVCIGVPFALAAMFLALHLGGQTLNVSVLLGVAIVLGIPLDDAVVVAEAISLRLNQGMARLEALKQALREVRLPVTASVLATVAAFAPLMLLPGILGKFMFVVPLTVILTLLASLLASLWILPSHVAGWHPGESAATPENPRRQRWSRQLRRRFGRSLAAAWRRPGGVIGVLAALLLLAAGSLAMGWIKVQWFTSDPLRVFNVNVTQAATSGIEDTLKLTEAVERRMLAVSRPGEVHASLSMAGMQFTPNEPLTGEHLGQVTISLTPESAQSRPVDDYVAAVRAAAESTPGVGKIAFQVLSADLPALSALNLRLSGARPVELAAAAGAMRTALSAMAGLRDIRDDTVTAKPGITLRVNSAAAARAGVDPYQLAGYIRLHFDGVPVAKVAAGSRTLEIVVRAKPMDARAVQAWLDKPLRLANGREVKPGELFTIQFEESAGQMRRVQYQPSVSLQAEIDRRSLSLAEAERHVAAAWRAMRATYPGVRLEFGGELDDVRASLAGIARLFVIGLGLMYLLLVLQFRHLLLPLLIMATAPMAFAGAFLGLLVSGQTLSLYTLYGGIALGGVAVNASIMLVAAAEDRRRAGFAALHAAFYAARRRLVPILITSLSIIAGLFSLAIGAAGQSVLWGPLAATLVWGLACATPLTLFVTPLLYAALRRGS